MACSAILCRMTKLLEEAVEELRVLPEDEQDRTAQALIAFARERHEYSFDDAQIAGIHTRWGRPIGVTSRATLASGTFSAASYEGARHARRGSRSSHHQNVPVRPERGDCQTRRRADRERYRPAKVVPAAETRRRR